MFAPPIKKGFRSRRKPFCGPDLPCYWRPNTYFFAFLAFFFGAAFFFTGIG
jgi:hypothetical protein